MEVTSSHRTEADIGKTMEVHKGTIRNVLASHAITGCDTVPCLFGIGEISALKILKDGYTLVSLGNQRADFNEVLQ